MSWTSSSRDFSQYDVVTVTLNVPDNGRGLLEVALRLVLFAGLIALFLMFLALVVYLTWNCDGDESVEEDTTPNDDNRSLSSDHKVVFTSYGTGEEDLESGIRRFGGSSSDDLYDENICSICFDNERTCLFIPCGHRVTCYTCAKRIVDDGIRNCPVCRAIIHEVRSLKIV